MTGRTSAIDDDLYVLVEHELGHPASNLVDRNIDRSRQMQLPKVFGGKRFDQDGFLRMVELCLSSSRSISVIMFPRTVLWHFFLHVLKMQMRSEEMSPLSEQIHASWFLSRIRAGFSRATLSMPRFASRN